MPFDETSDGAAYLSRLKQSTSNQGAATAPARAPEPSSAKVAPATIVANPANVKKEKRGSSRYKCKGSAHLRGGGGTGSTWATLADISLNGCYIETSAHYRVGDILGLKLEANSLQVEAVGEVRATYPGLGMGICFARISEANRGKLQDLVKSISQHSAILGNSVSALTINRDALHAVSNPHLALQAMLSFFEERRTMEREEFHQILRQSH
ncbi:MAG: PilZ domain-containing protein [Candidatus Sulfotelmatobacter sp.]